MPKDPGSLLGPLIVLDKGYAHPIGSGLLREAIGVDEHGQPRGILGDDELLRVIGNFPISTLAAFPGLGIDHSTVDRVLGQLPPR